MTRPKVDPDKRQRTACACDSCKRRKQKCNGHNPCNTCVKRQLTCVYTPTPINPEQDQSSIESPTKRRHAEKLPTTLKLEAKAPKVRPRRTSVHNPTLAAYPAEFSAMTTPNSDLVHSNSVETQARPSRGSLHGEVDMESRSKMSNGQADEAEAYSLQRMLQDSTGRLLYVGDSATLSYLQLIRMIVESIAGKSRFTMDPKRHMIIEARIDPPLSNIPAGVLPDRRTAEVLVKSYFINTTGFIEIFDKRTLLEQLNQCYQDPLTVDSAILCQLNLLFAIGLVLSRPSHGSEEEAIVQKLCGNKGIDRAEVFFRNAKELVDPVVGFEDADIWSVQALLLMAVYMLSVSKRNAAYAYYGMAVRSAFAFGLHREEDSFIFNETQCRVRRNLWRTLYILDRFLSASLGRPTAISDEDCSERALDAPEKSFETEDEQISSTALDASVRTSRIIGDTLKKVYSKRKISTSVAQDIAERFDDWNESLFNDIHWRRATVSPITPNHGIAILHINLLQTHSVILLARPFFLYILKATVTHKPSRLSQRMESFAQTCVEAAQHTMTIAQTALEAGHLARSNPFVIYFVFAAGLIILSNEFASLYHNPDAETAIASCIEILKYCAANDAQAQRVIYIIETFHEANANRPSSARHRAFPNRKVPIITSTSSNPQHDPNAHFFAYTKHSPGQQLHISEPNLKRECLNLPEAHSAFAQPMITSVLQQPSPDATGTSPVNAPVVSSGMPGVDAMQVPEIGFDFDELWPTWHAPNGAMLMGNHVELAENYGHHYPLDTPVSGVENSMVTNVNIPLYPANDFR